METWSLELERGGRGWSRSEAWALHFWVEGRMTSLTSVDERRPQICLSWRVGLSAQVQAQRSGREYIIAGYLTDMSACSAKSSVLTKHPISGVK